MILQRGSIIRLEPGQILFGDGSLSNIVFIILCGKIVIRGIEDNVLDVIGADESVGEEAYLLPKEKFR